MTDLNALPELTAVTDADLLIRDKDDTTDGPNGTDKFISSSNLSTALRDAVTAELVVSGLVLRFYTTSWPARGIVPASGGALWFSSTSGVIDPPDFVEGSDILMVPA